MAEYVLVHGGNMDVETWNRLTTGVPIRTADGKMGGRVWDPILPALRARGHTTLSPTLEDEHRANLTCHVDQVCALIVERDPRDVVLVAHSYGGMVITGVAARLADRILRMVYVDAAVPAPGQSLFDLIAASGNAPSAFIGLEPAPPYVEKLQFNDAKVQRIPKTYIRCTQSDFAPVTAALKPAILADRKQWAYFELPSSHVPMASMPDRLAELLLRAAP